METLLALLGVGAVAWLATRSSGGAAPAAGPKGAGNIASVNPYARGGLNAYLTQQLQANALQAAAQQAGIASQLAAESAQLGVSMTAQGTPPTTHVVQPGETLAHLAALYYDSSPLAQNEKGLSFASFIGAQILGSANPQYYPSGGDSLNCIQPGLALNIPALTGTMVNNAHAAQAVNPTTFTPGKDYCS
jgi:hypothetical protein